ncbi:hypothetical protein MTO96_033646 [Rhipicephalus appendiculatus]
MAPSSGRNPSNGAVCNGSGSSRRRWECIGGIVAVCVVIRAVAVTGCLAVVFDGGKGGEKTDRTSLERRTATTRLDPRHLGLEPGRYRSAGPEEP